MLLYTKLQCPGLNRLSELHTCGVLSHFQYLWACEISFTADVLKSGNCFSDKFSPNPLNLAVKASIQTVIVVLKDETALDCGVDNNLHFDFVFGA